MSTGIWESLEQSTEQFGGPVSEDQNIKWSEQWITEIQQEQWEGEQTAYSVETADVAIEETEWILCVSRDHWFRRRVNDLGEVKTRWYYKLAGLC